MREVFYPLQRNSPESVVFKPSEIIIILLFTIFLIVSIDILFYPSTLEDAYITFRYSKHLAEGYGFGAWNIEGVRVEGYTTFLWMFLMSMASLMGVEVRTVAKFSGIFFHVLLCSTLIIFPLMRRSSTGYQDDLLDNPTEFVLAGVFLGLYLPMSWYATSGMETVFFAALVGIGFVSLFLPYNSLWVSFVSILLVFTRPEGVVIAGAIITLHFLICQRKDCSLYGTLIPLFFVILSTGGLVLHRFITFGEIVPNTYWAKAGSASFGHFIWGIRYILDFTVYNAVIVFICGIGALSFIIMITKTRFRNGPAGVGVIVSVILIFVVYVAKVGGDNLSAFPYWRHFIHIASLIVFFLCYQLVRLFPVHRYVLLSVLLGVILISNMSILQAQNNSMLKTIVASISSYPNLYHLQHNEYYLRLKQISQQDTTIASSLGGELPYVVDATHIDVLGLNNPHIAKYGSFDPNGPQDSKTDMKWVLDQKPDFIEGYIPGTMVLNATPDEIKQYVESSWRSKMHKELFTSEIFQQEYMFVRNWPYDVLDRTFFVKKSYLLKRGLQIELDCVAIENTPLDIFASNSNILN